MKTPPDKSALIHLTEPVPYGGGLGVINTIKLTRMTSMERERFGQETKKLTDGLSVSRARLLVMIREAGDYDQENASWREEPMQKVTRLMLEEMDTLDEDRLFEACIALDFGYGSEEEWRQSDDFRRLNGEN